MTPRVRVGLALFWLVLSAFALFGTAQRASAQIDLTGDSVTIDATILPNGDLRMVDRRTFPNPSIFVGWPSDRLQDVRVFQDTAYLNDDFVTLDWPAFISSSG